MKRHHRYSAREARRPDSHAHLSDEQVLLWLDGELRPEQAEAVMQHLEACWSCRGRKQAIEQGIADVVEFHSTTSAASLLHTDSARANFILRLQAVARADRRPQARPPARWKNRLLDRLVTHQLSLTAAALILCALATLGLFLHSPPAVSAEELLQRTDVADHNLLSVTARPVVVQQVRISVGKSSITRTLYRDVDHQRFASRTNASEAMLDQARAAYAHSSLDWEALLDTAAYRRWQARLGYSHSQVVRLPRNRLQLRTTTSEGYVREAEVTVRQADYHIIDEGFLFGDQSHMQITELSYSVVSLASLRGAIFTTPAPAAAVVQIATPPRRPQTTSEAELISAELDAESALHSVGADMGEQITLQRRSNPPVLVSGVVTDVARKQELQAALGRIPHLRVELLTLSEAEQANQAAASPSSVRHPGSESQSITAGPPMLDQQLAAHFPDRGERTSYVNQTLALAQQASARAWALNRLADRYTPQSVTELPKESREKLKSLLEDHIAALRDDLSQLNIQLDRVLSQSSDTPAANATPDSVSLPVSGAPSSRGPDWRVRVHRIHSSTETIHEAVAALLASSQAGNADLMQIELRTSLTEVHGELQTLDQEVRNAGLQ